MEDSSSQFRKNLNSFYDSNVENLSEDEKFPLYIKLEDLDERYTTLSCLGKGGMKTVYKVFDQASEREVALAIPNQESTREKDEDFLREAHLASSLSHPNIMPIYDIGLNNDGIPYFVMELKTDQNLKDEIQNKSLQDENDYLNIFTKICDGIAYIHANHVLHLDLKPENIQIGKFGEVLICDWGCADFFKNGTSNSSTKKSIKSDLINLDLPTNVIMGTPGYLAPEIYESKENLSVKTDIYALGVILYELIFKRSPPTKAHESFNFHSQHVPKGLISICQKALTIDASKRYQKVDDLKNDILSYQSGFVPTAQKAHLGTLLVMMIKRHTYLSLTILTSFLILFIFSLIFIYNLNKSHLQTALALHEALEQQKISKQLTLDLEEKVVKEAKEFTYFGFYATPGLIKTKLAIQLRRLSDVISQNPHNYRAINTKAQLYFMTQQIKKANIHYAKLPDDFHTYYKNLSLSLEDEIGEERFIPRETLVELVKHKLFEDDRINYVFERMLTYDVKIRKEAHSEDLILKALLELINPAWSEKYFRYEAKNKSLILGGSNFNFFIPPSKRASNQSVLDYFKIDILTFLPSDFSDLQQLKGFIPARLDISKTQIKEIKEEHLPSPTQLISLAISQEQLDLNPHVSEIQGFKLVIKK